MTQPSNEPDDLRMQLAELRTDVHYIKSDVADIKVELRATNRRSDELKDSLTERIETVSASLNQRIDELRDSLTERSDKLRDDLSERIDKLKDSLHTSRIWAFGLYVSLLFVLAKGFKWM